MSSSVAEQRPIQFESGVEPSTDSPAFFTRLLTSASGIHFNNGRLEKTRGWLPITFDSSATISGTSRSLFSTIIGTKTYTTIGTHTRLYSIIGTQLTNITPVQTSTVAIADSLDSHYATLGSDPATTTNGSTFVEITDSEYDKFIVGDTYTLSGFPGDLNGIPQAQLNKAHSVIDFGTGTVIVRTTAAATSSGSGGGASVVRTSGLITVDATAHGLSDGDRVKLDDATDFGGFTAATEINVEHIIRNKATDTFDIMTSGTATSSVSNGGGGSTTYQKPIVSGNVNESFGQGYGAGRYGVGLYGTGLTSSSGRTLPRVWFFDKYGTNIISTAGGQTGVYTWNGVTTTAPVLVANAPTAVNYAFVSDNILVTLGAGGTENRVFASDQGDVTNWTSSSTNSVFDDNIEGAGKLITHTPLTGTNLLHTEQQVFTFRKIPRDSGVWEIKLLDPQSGIISAQARVAAKGIAFWMGQNAFWMFRGGRVEEIPCSIKNYVFEDLNRGQKSKIFAWYNQKYDEVHFHYPSEGSNEPDRRAILNLGNLKWCTDTISRTGAEYPNVSLIRPRIINVSTLYRHDSGVNDDASGLSWNFTTPLYSAGKGSALLTKIIPDSIQEGDITLVVKSYQYPRSATAIDTQTFTVSETTESIDISIRGRFWNYTFSGSAVDGDFVMGSWMEELQKSGAG